MNPAYCPIHGRLSPKTMTAFGWEPGDGCPLIMADEEDCGKPLTVASGAVEAVDRLIAQVEQLSEDRVDRNATIARLRGALDEAARQLDLAAMNIVDRDTNRRVKEAAARARCAP